MEDLSRRLDIKFRIAGGNVMRKAFKGFLVGFLVVAAMTFLVACNNNDNVNANQDAEDQRQYFEVTDLAGNTVQVPEDIQSVVVTSYKGAFEALVLLGRMDLLAGMCDTSRYAWLLEVYPELKDVPDYGSFENVNVEELLKADVDIIFSPTEAPEVNEQMLSLGMPVYVDGAVNPDEDATFSSQTELLAVAEVIGETDKANELIEWRQGWLDFVAERVADIPEEERKTAITINESIQQVWNNTYLCGADIELADGINLVADYFPNTYYGELSAEELIALDPDFIFQTIGVREYGDELRGYYQQLQADERFNGITAIENGDVYIMPYGIAGWDDDYEIGICVVMLAKLMYPDRFEDVDVWEIAQDFYSRFLGIEITEDDWLFMHQHDFDGARPLVVYHD